MNKIKSKIPTNYKLANVEYTENGICPWCGHPVKLSTLLYGAKQDFLSLYLLMHKKAQHEDSQLPIKPFIVHCSTCHKEIAGYLDVLVHLNAVEKITEED